MCVARLSAQLCMRKLNCLFRAEVVVYHREKGDERTAFTYLNLHPDSNHHRSSLLAVQDPNGLRLWEA